MECPLISTIRQIVEIRSYLWTLICIGRNVAHLKRAPKRRSVARARPCCVEGLPAGPCEGSRGGSRGRKWLYTAEVRDKNELRSQRVPEDKTLSGKTLLPGPAQTNPPRKLIHIGRLEPFAAR